MHIRPENPNDITAISQLTHAAFLHHPHHAPGALPTEHKIVDELRKAGALTLSLVMEDGGTVLGHVAFSPVLINGKEQGWYGLGPVSVLPEYQRQGIGSALIRSGLEELKSRGARGCVLVGDPAYYTRLGFRQRQGLVLDGVPPEVFLGLAFAEPFPVGKVTFHDAFSVPPDQ